MEGKGIVVLDRGVRDVAAPSGLCCFVAFPWYRS